ncbi:MAG: hypothetical protein LBU57_08925 [Dysgonamonadaceae bacterium]|jgi:Mg2+ and Co2+ transporter CorA|nr:hypothetical protein [Dysgonamonadaceae bacterium]
MYSYHIFYFPFIWENPETKGKLFSEQTNLSVIPVNTYTNWLRSPDMSDKEKEDFYNEQNFYYKYVHPVLYDKKDKEPIVCHYERKEPQEHEVSYIISVKDGKTYKLKVDAMNLNLYATGVGMLTFYLKNEKEDQKEPQDILKINQYGRRIFPPFFADIGFRNETAVFLQIEGLNGEQSNFCEDFSSYGTPNSDNLYTAWRPACFIKYLIADLSETIEIKPVIDDRMFVSSWYKNNDLTKKFEQTEESLDDFFSKDDFWYKYLFVDINDPTCQNDAMKKELVEKHTYKRWQKGGSLYGISRYSFVMLTNNKCPDFLLQYFQTMYARMTELVLLQRASRLRFSDEVNRLSNLSRKNVPDKKMIEQISSLYKEYIRFINRIYFKDVTAQEQGIELYDMFFKTMNVSEHVKELDEEINELNEYVNMLDDKIRNKHAKALNTIAIIFLPATFVFSWFGMNDYWDIPLWKGFLIGLSASAVGSVILLYLINKFKK